MPPTVMAVAIRRNAHTLLPPDQSKNWGKRRLRIRVYIATKIGRLLTIVEIRDTGPLSIAQNNTANPEIAIVSAINAIVKVEPRCLTFCNCLKKRGRIENENQKTVMQSEVTENIFQDDIWARAYFAIMSAKA